ncbi:replication-associated recombination protein A [uncultured Succinatimonas sp.]|uniref:replication-associated recombination protein A n=1 Tax=uncultured Succinatimonas sp. TaxID=1262973 RepID=UPI0025D8A933|nr:replication-associated recombination protein A [uncultured Succinatimonas sp.]
MMSAANYDLFSDLKVEADKEEKQDTDVSLFVPLASRMRPKSLDDYIGQSHLIGPGRPLRMALERKQSYSMIFWGPPGVGKTTLALIIAKSSGAVLEQISAVTAGVKDIRAAIDRAMSRKRQGVRTVLFVDEVHRFNKSQQDAFLPYIENGTIIFIGATTENPSFELNSALLSRARVYVLKKLSPEELRELLHHALKSEKGLKSENLILADKVEDALIDLSEGDGRHLLNTLEMLVDLAAPYKDGAKIITFAMVGAVAGRRLIKYDKGGDAYYDLISAFHKSVRGSAPDAALYWYARILAAGGDPLYVARRLLAIATEDVGLADPRAMQVALNAWDIYERVGAAEGERAIAEAAVYLAIAPKSNALYTAFHQAKEDAEKLPSFDVPLYLRNAPTKLMENLGYHKGYRYAHDFPGAYAAGECFMPEELDGRTYYKPNDRGLEIQLKAKLDYLKDLDNKAIDRRYPPEHQNEVKKRLG